MALVKTADCRWGRQHAVPTHKGVVLGLELANLKGMVCRSFLRSPKYALVLAWGLQLALGSGCNALDAADAQGGTGQLDAAANPVPDAKPVQPQDSGATPDGGERDSSTIDPVPQVWVKVGVPDEATYLDYVELAPGGDIAVQAGGQGSSHALLAVQCRGLGGRVFFSATVRNLDGEGEVSLKELPRTRPIACDSDTGICKIAPIFVPLGGVAPRQDWDGLHVEVSATVRNESGESVSGSAIGYLREEEPFVAPVRDAQVLPEAGSVGDASDDGGVSDAAIPGLDASL